MGRKTVVVDANILIRAVLGKRVRRILETYSEAIVFFVADIAYAEAEEHIGQLTEQRGGDVDVALRTLRSIVALGAVAEHNLYEIYEIEARKRLGARDPEDWPTLAAALALSCPIWTEDTDFFGCGVATWTCQNIELYLEQ